MSISKKVFLALLIPWVAIAILGVDILDNIRAQRQLLDRMQNRLALLASTIGILTEIHDFHNCTIHPSGGENRATDSKSTPAGNLQFHLSAIAPILEKTDIDIVYKQETLHLADQLRDQKDFSSHSCFTALEDQLIKLQSAIASQPTSFGFGKRFISQSFLSNTQKDISRLVSMVIRLQAAKKDGSLDENDLQQITSLAAAIDSFISFPTLSYCQAAEEKKERLRYSKSHQSMHQLVQQLLSQKAVRFDPAIFCAHACSFRHEILSIQTIDINDLKISLGTFQDKIDRALWKTGFILVLLFLTPFAALAILHIHVIRPIRRATSLAGQIGAGDWHARIPIQGRDETGQLAATLNQMAKDQGAVHEHLKLELENRQRMEKDLLAAKNAAETAAAAKSGFLASMSHEIRTPMNGILGALRLLSDSPLENRQREMISICQSSAETLLQLLNDILDFSKIEAGKMEMESIPFDLHETLGDVLKTMSFNAHVKGLELNLHIDPNVPPILLGDPGRLKQIVFNLVGNAIKFTNHGEVAVNAWVEQRAPQKIQIHFSVKDTGIGIPLDKQKEIFQPFTQADASISRKHEGTGLGLAICSQLVRLMDGRIWVESAPDKGSSFHFLIETSYSTQPTPALPSSSISKFAGMQVLVATGNPTNLSNIAEMLKNWKMIPITAVSGLKALDQLRREHQAGNICPLVILDASLPESDGFEVTQTIRADPELAGVKWIVMMLSSVNQQENNRRCQELKINFRLHKPVKQSELFNLLSSLAQGRHPPVPQRKAPSFLPPVSQKLKILLAEDNQINQYLVTEIFKRRGHQTTIVNNGREALNAWRNGGFDLIVMDVQMPEMDGYTATKTIRAEEKNSGARIPIIAVTAHSMKGDDQKCLDAGMDDYVAKPITPERLIAVVERFTFPQSAPPATPPQKDAEFSLEQMVPYQIGGMEVLRQAARIFLADYPSLLTAIKQSIAGQNADAARQAAHTLKGAAANLGAQSLSATAGEIESLAQKKDFAGIETAFSTLENKLRDLKSFLDKTLPES
ncbi:MAG: response regulator [Verrucomicrobiae bacterium]|nr:response regulator [Verrucomicrobiae bacterium]